MPMHPMSANPDLTRRGVAHQPTAVVPPQQPDEAELVQRLKAGDGVAMETVVRRFGGRMHAVALRLLRDEHGAHDAVQDAFLSAFKSIGRFEGGSRLSTWLHRIVVNAALMKLRQKARRDERSIEEFLPAFEGDGHRRNVRGAWQEPAEALLERAEVRTMVRGKIDMLPDDYRTVLLLRDIEELDTDETAAVLGIRPGAVKTRLHRARLALRELLESELAP
jgi:RNA polymerase sigma-70 factor, ECF subfamily